MRNYALSRLVPRTSLGGGSLARNLVSHAQDRGKRESPPEGPPVLADVCASGEETKKTLREGCREGEKGITMVKP